MARKRVGYHLDADEIDAFFNLFEPDNPQERLLECAEKGDVTSEKYKAARADFNAAKEQGAPMGRLYRKVTKTPVSWTLDCSGGTSAMGGEYDPRDPSHATVVEMLNRHVVAIAMDEVKSDNAHEMFASFKVPHATLVTGGLYRLGEKIAEPAAE